MKHVLALSLFLLILLVPTPSRAAAFSEIIRGRILLDVETHGEAWYVYPPSLTRWYLGRPADAFEVMRRTGLGITDADLARIPTVGEAAPAANLALRQRLAGRVLLQVQKNGEAWYVYPGDLRRYYLGRPEDAFAIMRQLGLGISPANLARVAVDPQSMQPAVPAYAFSSYTLTNAQGSFPVSVLALPKERFEMVTDTASVADCARDCPALSLRDFVNRNQGFAGIHGTYFCPPDYPACANLVNSFNPPVYNSAAAVMVNGAALKFFHRPFVISTPDGQLTYFHRADAFDGREVQGAIGNWPSLVEQGQSVEALEPSEPGFFVSSTRGGMGWNNQTIFLVIAHGATMEQFASVFVSLGATYALNLDGGGSAALYADGAYRVGPGRLLPNAVIFRARP